MRALGIISLCLIAACGGPSLSKPLSISEIAPSLQIWNGRTIVAEGWIYGCHHGFECRLMRSSGAPDADNSLILDYVESIEDSLGHADGRRILLKAKVTDECVVNICTDRAPALIPIRILKVY